LTNRTHCVAYHARHLDSFKAREALKISQPTLRGEDHITVSSVVRELERDGVSVLRGLLAGKEGFLDALLAEDCFKQPSLLKNKEDPRFSTVDEPLLNCRSTIPLVFTPLFEAIASAYIGAPAGVGGVNLRRSKRTELQEEATLLFHSDKNQARFLKFFIYMTPVDTGSGPFTYVTGSHKRRFRGWDSKYRWSYEEIAGLYGSQAIKEFHGEVGDVVVADTTGFHRGKKVRDRERAMLTVNYQIGVEHTGKGAPQILQADLEASLPSHGRHAADFLRVTGTPAPT